MLAEYFDGHFGSNHFWITYDDGGPVGFAYYGPEPMASGRGTCTLLPSILTVKGKGAVRNCCTTSNKLWRHAASACYWWKLLDCQTLSVHGRSTASTGTRRRRESANFTKRAMIRSFFARHSNFELLWSEPLYSGEFPHGSTKSRYFNRFSSSTGSFPKSFLSKKLIILIILS